MPALSETELNAQAQELIQLLIPLTASDFVNQGQVMNIVNTIGIQGTQARIYFMTQLKEMIRLMPVKIYPAPENRARLLEAAQGALDTLIEKEQEEEAEMDAMAETESDPFADPEEQKPLP